MKLLPFIFLYFTLILPAFGMPQSHLGDMNNKSTLKPASNSYPPKIVTWQGTVIDRGTHPTPNNHQLNFVHGSDGRVFDIVDSPQLTRVHSNLGKQLRVMIVAERTPKVFMFWGDNLIVKKFEILEELDSVSHDQSVPRSTRSFHHR